MGMAVGPGAPNPNTDKHAMASRSRGGSLPLTRLIDLSLSGLEARPAGWSTAPGGANSSGVGFCVSQLAQFPEQSVGTSSAGEAIRQVATSGPGAVPDTLEGARYPACGGPAAAD
jgi:hypothetical protein